jgi:hypothetical protein
MRDFIWTVIIIWVIWRIIEAFRGVSSASRKVKQEPHYTHEHTQTNNQTHNSTQPKKGELKSDAGEYIDYEEVK